MTKRPIFACDLSEMTEEQLQRLEHALIMLQYGFAKIQEAGFDLPEKIEFKRKKNDTSLRRTTSIFDVISSL